MRAVTVCWVVCFWIHLVCMLVLPLLHIRCRHNCWRSLQIWPPAVGARNGRVQMEARIQDSLLASVPSKPREPILWILRDESSSLNAGWNFCDWSITHSGYCRIFKDSSLQDCRPPIIKQKLRQQICTGKPYNLLYNLIGKPFLICVRACFFLTCVPGSVWHDDLSLSLNHVQPSAGDDEEQFSQCVLEQRTGNRCNFWLKSVWKQASIILVYHSVDSISKYNSF